MIPEEYLQSIRERLVDDWVVTSFRILRERATDADAYIRGVLELFDGSKLEFSEYVQVAPGSVIDVATYSYHLPVANGDLIYRWDNAPHHPGVSGFPHHYHSRYLPQDLVEPSEPMSIFRVLDDLLMNLP
jgi:hypothetical protein